MYLNYALTSLVEIPANILVVDNCERYDPHLVTAKSPVHKCQRCLCCGLSTRGEPCPFCLQVGRALMGFFQSFCFADQLNCTIFIALIQLI